MAPCDPPASPTISWPLNRPSQRTPWDPTTAHANGHAGSAAPVPAYPPSSPLASPITLPNGRYPLSGISLRAFFLGLALGISITLAAFLAVATLAAVPSPLWRVPFFVSALSLFHFLEYYITAAYNPVLATTSAFLFSANGSAYNAAHSLALLETILTHTIIPYGTSILPSLRPYTVWLGLGMMLIGQATRSLAMAQAGTNFNHTVQQQKARGHELVTTGVYGTLRHPSYFGFFWWGLGTQLVLGNVVCFLGFTLVLWRFFHLRIRSEST